MTDQPKQPREHHYAFAHEVVRDWVFQQEDLFVQMLRPNAGNLFVSAWQQLGQIIAADGGEALPVEGFDGETLTIGGHPAIVLTFPPTQAPGEAAMACALEAATVAERRYFVYVERGDGSGENALCEWLPDGRRLNYEAYGSPNADALIALVEKLLELEQQGAP